MATLAEIGQHRQAVGDLTTLAERDLLDFLRSLGIDDPKRIAKAVREFLPELVAAYTTAASTLSADWYEALRTEAAVALAFTATTLDAPAVDDLQHAIGYALTPLFVEEPSSDEASTRLRDLVGSIVRAADRQTITANAARDRSGPRYARHASANACAFCRMLATRGAEYRSEESALRVTLRRGIRKQGEKYHDNCHCTAVPTWSPQTYEEAPYVADWREAYYDATKKLGGASNTKAILAEMRQSLDIAH